MQAFLKFVMINPFIFFIVVLQFAAFAWAMVIGQYKTGLLMLVYGAGNAIIGWMK